MSISTTNIDDLPSKNDEGVVMSSNNVPQTNTSDNIKEKRLAETELINGIQKAASSGMTTLPSRDIPMDQAVVHEDVEVKANYLPQTSEGDYITKHQTSEEIIRQNAQHQQDKDKWDDIYSELSVPILISALYFIDWVIIIDFLVSTESIILGYIVLNFFITFDILFHS